MRVFRYRAIAAVALACALVLTGVFVKQELDENSELSARIAETRATGGVITLAEIAEVEGVEVMVWEVVVDDSPTSFVHVLAWDELGRDFTIAIARPEADGRASTLTEVDGSGGGGERTHADLWQEIELPAPASEVERLTFDVEIGGEDISGTIPFAIDI